MIISELVKELESFKSTYGDCSVELISITSTSWNSTNPNTPAEKKIEEALKEQHQVKIILAEDDLKGINIKAYKSFGWMS